MANIKVINKGGEYGDLGIRGRNRNEDVGLYINVPAGEVARFRDVTIENVFHPIINRGPGRFEIEGLNMRKYGGDGIVAKHGNFLINYTLVSQVTPTRPYAVCERQGNETIEQCLARHGETVFDPSLLKFQRHPAYKGEVIYSSHVDAIIQMYATNKQGQPDPTGVISDIRMPNIIAKLEGSNVQAIMASENSRTTDVHFGYESLKVDMDYPYFAALNTLDHGTVGCAGAKLPAGCGVKIKEVKPRPSHIPADEVRTFDNKIEGFDSACIIEGCTAADHACDAELPAEDHHQHSPVHQTPVKEIEKRLIPVELLVAMGIDKARALEWQEPLEYAALTYGIDCPIVAEDFLAQTIHESNKLRSVRENMNYTTPQRLCTIWPRRFSMHRNSGKLCAADYVRNPEKLANAVYSNRMGNGNEASGDGHRFSAAGIGALTGRDMWEAYRDFSGNDVVSDPTLFDDKYISADSAAWMFAVAKGLIDEAKADMVKTISKRINGGYIGLEDREELTAIARGFYTHHGFDLHQQFKLPSEVPPPPFAEDVAMETSVVYLPEPAADVQQTAPTEPKLTMKDAMNSRTIRGTVQSMVLGAGGTGFTGIQILNSLSGQADEAKALIAKGKETIAKVEGIAADAGADVSKGLFQSIREVFAGVPGWVPWAAVGVMFALMIWKSNKARKARIDDHNTGKNRIKVKQK